MKQKTHDRQVSNAQFVVGREDAGRDTDERRRQPRSTVLEESPTPAPPASKADEPDAIGTVPPRSTTVAPIARPIVAGPTNRAMATPPEPGTPSTPFVWRSGEIFLGMAPTPRRHRKPKAETNIIPPGQVTTLEMFAPDPSPSEEVG